MGGVAVGFCYSQTTQTPQWAYCYRMLLVRDMAAHPGRIVAEFGREASGVHVPDARSKIVAHFLDHPAKPDWLWIIDTDATFADDTLDRLLAAADVAARPIVGALAFGVKPTREPGNAVLASPLQTLPTLYTYDADRTNRIDNYPRDAVVQVHGTGAHCLLIHRRALADKRWHDDGHPLPWFRTAVRAGEMVSEDQFFCMKAGSLGYPIHVDTSIKTGHVKTFIADEEWHLAHTYPAPATERVAVIVPVMGRPRNAAPFMQSLQASTGLATAYAVAHEDDVDTWTAWAEHGASVLFCDEPGFAPKVNLGYRETSEPWLFVVGDDVRFREGWYDRALRAAGADKHLVSVNDCGNRVVMDGNLAPHPLLRRAWVDEHGASWDGPKTVAHEGYRHWFVDNEWTAVAQQAGVFAYAPDAVVEHLHPVFGKAEDDDVYRKGQAHVDQDRRLFIRREKANRP